MKVNNLKEFLVARGCDEEDFSEVERATYKYTSCGAWIKREDEWEGSDYVDMFGNEHEAEHLWSGLTVGSIVEGVDEGCTPITLKYPFEIADFWKALESVEKEAEEIWNDTHGCEDCGEENPETGYTPINPECKTCNGEGAIL